ncbi:SapC family protein [Sphingomonas sp. DT-51]|uniref:SapC family protein n=1 Tax=Sphingomonas sp. DT-51 TaxID=3396165 RepID=UPI003F1CD14F
MASWELLASERHAALTMRRAEAAGRHFVQVVPGEFAKLATCCPIVLTKHPETGRFYAGALLGFLPGENLAGDLDGVMPLDLEREGFFIVDADIAVDLEQPRFAAANMAAESERLALFDGDGAPSAHLRRVQRALGLLHAGLQESEALVQALLDARLVEPIDVSLSFDDGERLRLEGLYTVSRDALAELDDATALRLFRAGQLHHAHTLIDSLQQIARLAHRRNERLALA